MRTRLNARRDICILIIIALLGFIFIRSAQSPTVSANESGSFSKLLIAIFSKIGINLNENNFFILYIRKFAHLTEYFALGATLCVFVELNCKIKFQNFLNALWFGAVTAVTDETIQLFSNRGSSVLDVWLDIFGVIFAIFLTALIFYLLKKRKTKNKKVNGD